MNTEKRLLTVTEADQWNNFGKHAKMVRICSANHAPTQIFSHTHRIIHTTRIRGNFWKTGCHMQMLTSNLEIGINCIRRNMLKQQSFVWRSRMKKRTLTSLLITTLLSDFHTFSRMTTQTNLNYFSGLPRRVTTLLTGTWSQPIWSYARLCEDVCASWKPHLGCCVRWRWIFNLATASTCAWFFARPCSKWFFIHQLDHFWIFLGREVYAPQPLPKKLSIEIGESPHGQIDFDFAVDLDLSGPLDPHLFFFSKKGTGPLHPDFLQRIFARPMRGFQKNPINNSTDFFLSWKS